MNSLEGEKEQILKGLLGFAVLVQLSAGEQYGVQLLTNLQSTPFATQAGTLYPLLNRLAKQGLITHRVAASPVGPQRKYYSLTAAGIQRKNDLTQYWQVLTKIITENS